MPTLVSNARTACDAAVREVVWCRAHPEVGQMVMEALRPLSQAFGGLSTVRFALVPLPDGEYMVRVSVLIPAGWPGDPEAALATFDEGWWLHNCHRSGGLVVVDYEQAAVPVALDASED